MKLRLGPRAALRACLLLPAACLTLATLPVTVRAQVPADRMPASGWAGQVGVPGGIPSTYTQYCNVKVSIPGSNLVAVGDGVTDDAPAINAALTSCPDGQFVYVPAGTYRLNSTIGRVGTNPGYQKPFSIVLRGAGPDLTKFEYYGTGSAIYLGSNGVQARRVSITAGKQRGSTALTLGWVDPFYSPNTYAIIERQNADAIPAGSVPSYMTYSAAQIVKMTSLNGTAATISPALNEAYATDTINVGISSPMRCGLENFSVENKTGGGAHNIQLVYAHECWIRNVTSIRAAKWHIRLDACARSEVRECTIYGFWNGGGDSAYGVGLYRWCSNNLVENNVLYNLRHSLITEYGGQGNVFGYNYSYNPINESGLETVYLMGDLCHHGGMPKYTLWEGNVAATIKSDNVLGGAYNNTFFRNRIQRKGLPATYVACFGSDIQRANHRTTLVGNIYELPPSRYDPSQYGSRRWGTQQDDPSNGDPLSLSTAILHGEYDTATGTLTWGEGDRTLPSSLYLTAKPAWFGSLRWPAFDSTQPNDSSVESIPAGYRVVRGSPPAVIEGAPSNVRINVRIN